MKREDARELQRIIAGADKPDLEQRVRWLLDALEVLEASKRPGAIFLAGAFRAWLTRGDDLQSQHLRLTATRGSHSTPQRIYQTLQERGLIADEAGRTCDVGIIRPSTGKREA